MVTHYGFIDRLHVTITLVHSSDGLIVSLLESGSSDSGLSLAGVIVLCSWARHFTLIVPLSTQEYKWVPANCQGNITKMLRGRLGSIHFQLRRADFTHSILQCCVPAQILMFLNTAWARLSVNFDFNFVTFQREPMNETEYQAGITAKG